MHIVMTGNPLDGFVHWGPFDSWDDAVAFGEDHLDGDWWVVSLRAPDTAEDG